MGGLCREVSTLLSAQMCFRRGEAWEAAKLIALSLASDVETLPCRTGIFENPSGSEESSGNLKYWCL